MGGRRITGVVAAFAIGLLSAAAPASAQTFVWAGGGMSWKWGEGANWQGGKAPSAADGSVDIDFPLEACQPAPLLCPGTVNDIPSLTVGELKLEARVIRWTPKEPLEIPQLEPPPEAYSIAGGEGLMLSEGIEVHTIEEGTGTGAGGSSGSYVNVPLELVGDNTWQVLPAALATLGIWKPVSGAHALTVHLGEDASLQLAAPVEVGPVSIVGSPSAYASIYGAGGSGDLNGSDRQPVHLSDAGFSGSGTIGPLTLEAVALHVGQFGPGGALEVAGNLVLDGASRVAFDLPRESVRAPAQLQIAGSVQLGGAQLELAPYCLAPGASWTILHAQAEVSGRFSDALGTTIESGQVLPAPPYECAPGVPATPVRIDYSSHDVTATAPVPSPSPPQSQPLAPPAVAGSSTGSGAVMVFSAASRAALLQDLLAARTGARIGALLRHGGKAVRVRAEQAGTLTLEWSARGGGRHARTVVLATGTVRFPGPGSARVRMRLTRRGRALLSRSRRVRVLVRESFVAAGFSPLALEGRMTLRH